MKSIFENVILSGDFDLTDMLKKIKTAWVEGDFSDEERTTLVDLARQHAAPENTFAPLQKQIDNAFSEIAALRSTVEAQSAEIAALRAAVESLGGTVQPEEPEPPEEWTEYVQPTGAHDAYQNGDKITYNSEKYICIAPDGVACVWSPDDYPAYWQKQ